MQVTNDIESTFFSLPINPELKLTVDKQAPEMFYEKSCS